MIKALLIPDTLICDRHDFFAAPDGSRYVASRHETGAISFGTVDLRHGRYAGGGMRYVRFSQWLQSLPPPGEIYFEEVRRHLGTDAACLTGGATETELRATLTAWAEANKIPYRGVPVGTIKGNADKAAVKADDNEADARRGEE